MPFKPQETPHSSYRRLALTISTSILLSSFLATILSIVYARQLYNAPLNTYLEEEYSYANRHKNYRWSKAWYFFYAPFLPLVTLCHSAIETALLRTRRLNVWWSASTGYVMFVSWVAVVVLWWICDCGGSYYGGCQQYFIDSDHVGSPIYWEGEGYPDNPGGVNTGVTIAKMSFGHVCMVLYYFYIPITCFALQKSTSLKRMAKAGALERRWDDLELRDLPSDNKTVLSRDEERVAEEEGHERPR